MKVYKLNNSYCITEIDCATFTRIANALRESATTYWKELGYHAITQTNMEISETLWRYYKELNTRT